VEATASIPASPRYKIAEQEILDAACAVFAADGFDHAKMATIAARAGTTKPTLYARFGSKQDLFGAAVGREYELLKAQLFAAYETGDDEPFRRRLRRWNDAYFDFVRNRPDGFRLISEGERYPDAAAIVERANSDIVDRIAALVMGVSGRRAPHGARLVASMIAGMLRACARDAVGPGQVDLDDAARLSEQFLYSALRGLDRDLMDAVDRRGARGRK
jgi:AcrR family transcriptional regulator